jgi:FkbM family methyltransferase
MTPSAAPTSAVGRLPRLLPRRSSGRRRVLPNGLEVSGASRVDTRYQQFILDYFRPDVDFFPMTVMDVGANIGLFSLEVLRRCGGDVALLAFEPAPETFAHLRQNLAEHFPDARVRLFRRAVGERPGEATFYFRPGASATSSLYPEAMGGDTGPIIDAVVRELPAGADGPQVPAWFRRLPRPVIQQLIRIGARLMVKPPVETRCKVTTVSEVLREESIEGVDFLKIDVEGAELDVVRGIRPEHWQRIRRVSVEVHDSNDRLRTIREILEGPGFDDVRVEQE